MRTFSKAMGLAGLRLGYAMTSTDLAALLNAAGGPYAVSSVAVALGLIAWNTWEDRSAYLARVGAERAVLSRVLRELGAEVLPSEANFVTARVADAPEARAELSRRGIAVRTFPSSVDLSADLRITLPGDEASFERLIEALKRRPELIGPVPRSAPEPAESRAREVLP